MSLSTITPVARLELFLQDIADGTNTSDPVSRPEEFLRRIAETNGDQDAALAHIAAQVPVDPTSEDVGKVMTVIADTSGEDPVYKWSAEEPASGALTLAFHDITTDNFNDGDFTLPAIPATSTYAELATAVRNGLFHDGITAEEQYTYLEQHIKFYAHGQRYMPKNYTLQGSSIDLICYITVPAIIGGSNSIFIWKNTLTIEKTGSFLVTSGKTNWDPYAVGTVSGSITFSRDISVHREIYL